VEPDLITVPIASTRYWRASLHPANAFRGEILLLRQRTRGEAFQSALVHLDENGEERREMLSEPGNIEQACDLLDKRLDELEALAYVPDPSDDRPRRIGAAAAAGLLEETRRWIDLYFRLPGPPPVVPEQVSCAAEQLEHSRRLFTIPRGSLYLASIRGRACFYIDQPSMIGYVPDCEGDQIEPGSVKAFLFQSPEDRWAYVTHYRWDRMRDDYLHEELRALYELTADGRGSLALFEDAYLDAKKAIESLPCESCGRILWPIIAKPQWGSAEWWDDPLSYFACRHCGAYFAETPAPWFSRQPTTAFPFEQVVTAERRAAAASPRITDSPGQPRRRSAAVTGQTFELRSASQSDQARRHVWLRRMEDGALSLEGQDLGGGVGEFFGSSFSEYEWAWLLPAPQLHLLLDRLGVAESAPDIVQEVGRRLEALGDAEAQARFKDAGATFSSHLSY
jgi:hypothetical protein